MCDEFHSEVWMSHELKQPLSIEIRHLTKNLGLLCGQGADGKHWHLSETEAIAGLQDGTWRFYIRVDGHDVPIIIAADMAGNKFLAARVDGKITDDLLSLPEPEAEHLCLTAKGPETRGQGRSEQEGENLRIPGQSFQRSRPLAHR